MAAALVSGQLSRWFEAPQIILGYGALALVAAVLTLLRAREPQSAVVTAA